MSQETTQRTGNNTEENASRAPKTAFLYFLRLCAKIKRATRNSFPPAEILRGRENGARGGRRCESLRASMEEDSSSAQNASRPGTLFPELR